MVAVSGTVDDALRAALAKLVDCVPCHLTGISFELQAEALALKQHINSRIIISKDIIGKYDLHSQKNPNSII